MTLNLIFLLYVNTVYTGVPVIFSRIRHIDHFRGIGWYNVALGLAFFVLLIFTFHGEFKWNRKYNYFSLTLIRSKASKCCQKSNAITFLVS